MQFSWEIWQIKINEFYYGIGIFEWICGWDVAKIGQEEEERTLNFIVMRYCWGFLEKCSDFKGFKSFLGESTKFLKY